MVMEKQTMEWKESWHDKYLKWVCDFANAFFRSWQIEEWGRGIGKMKTGCIADNLPLPEFNILPSIFSICFHIRNNQTESDADNVNGGVNFGINATEQNILELMLKNPQIKTVIGWYSWGRKMNISHNNHKYGGSYV
jgi:hypothetical protein